MPDSLAEFDTVWKIWTCAVLGSFAILEGMALIQNMRFTLSAWLRRHLGIDPWKKRYAKYGIIFFLSFFVWFIPHILLGRS